MRPPVILDNRGDVCVFATAEQALAYAEWQDVEAGEYVAYDSEGRLLHLAVVKPRGFFARPSVFLAGEESQPGHAGQLRDALSDFLDRVGESPSWLASASLGELVERSWEYGTR